MTSQHLSTWYSQKAIFAGSLLQGKHAHFFEKNLLDLIALVFFLIFVIRRHAYYLLLDFLSLLWKMDSIWSAFFQKKSYYWKTTRFDLHCDWKEIWSFLRNNHIVSFVSFSDTANNFDEKAEGFNAFKIILIKRQHRQRDNIDQFCILRTRFCNAIERALMKLVFCLK